MERLSGVENAVSTGRLNAFVEHMGERIPGRSGLTFGDAFNRRTLKTE
jgi:hypothetical protein